MNDLNSDPGASGSVLKVLQISDLHLSSEPHSKLGGVDVDAGLGAVLDHLRRHRWPADIILATGDLVQDEGAAAYRRLQNMLTPLAVPVYCLPGNHDIPAELDAVLADGPVRRGRQVFAGGWQFLMLDSSQPHSAAGKLASRELEFLDRSLSKEPNKPAMVCLHHHPVPTGSEWLDSMLVSNAEELFAVLDLHSTVKAVIFGHIHQTLATSRNGVELLGVPSTCAQFAPGVELPAYDTREPGYRWFELHVDGTLNSGVERASIESSVSG